MILHLKKLLLIVIVMILALVAAEGIARMFLDPTDYLWRRLKSDEILRYRVEPNIRGHDSWGFRNKSVPQEADIVAIGDSQTYGSSALARHSWPSILGKLTGEEVYNMSLGGYGPAEYKYLMEHKALLLKPNLIIAGFSFGNDLTDTFDAVYNVSIWEDLRDPDIAAGLKNSSLDAGGNTQISHSQNTFMIQLYLIADWFSGHSVLYRLVTTSSIGDQIRQKRIIMMGENVEMFEDDEHGIYTGFTPDKWILGLDLEEADVREGLRLSLEFFNQMNQIAKKNNIEFLVVLIPVKESVYSEFIEGNESIESTRQIDRLLENERQVRKIVMQYFDDHGIWYLDILEPLKNAAGIEQIYLNNYSGHPNKRGNAIIAESVNKYLKSKRQIPLNDVF